MMKTAMQELKEKLQSINERYHLKGDSDWLMNEVLDLVENYLEKEKEQLLKEYHRGMVDEFNIILNVAKPKPLTKTNNL